MKKFILILAMALSLSTLTSCGSKNKDNDDNKTVIPSENTPSDSKPVDPRPTEELPGEIDERKEIYELAVQSGYSGSYEEWLEGIKGETGKDGKEIELSVQNNYLVWRYKGDSVWNNLLSISDLIGPEGNPGPEGKPGADGKPGAEGKPGTDGKSAYEIYCEAHPEYKKTEAEWLDDLVNGRLGNEEKFTVSFNTHSNSTIELQKIRRGDKVKRPTDPIKAGHTFTGWYVGDEKWVFNGYPVTEDITLEAHYIKNIYTVSIDADNGTDVIHKEVTYGDKLTLEKPTKENFIFVNWVDNNGIEVDENYIVEGNVTITAVWGQNYTISFNTSGGNELPPLQVVSNSMIKELPIPTISGAFFMGWGLDGMLLDTPFKYTYNRNITLTAYWRFVDEDYQYQELADGTLKLVGYNSSDINLVIPDTIKNKKITVLGENLFSNNPLLKSIKLGKYITTVENNAFNNCSNLEEVIFNDNITSYGENLFVGSNKLNTLELRNNVQLLSLFEFDEKNIPDDLNIRLKYKVDDTLKASENLLRRIQAKKINITLVNWANYIPESYFRSCNQIKEITIPSNIITIRDSAFYDCSSLESVYLQEGLKSIGQSAFNGCSSLKNIKLPDSLTELGSCAFAHCESLTSIDIPNKVENLGFSTFERCFNLANVKLPDNLIEIGNYAFLNCKSIKSITLPKNVTTIHNAFVECTSLRSIYIPEKVSLLADGAFSDCTSLVAVSLPKSLTKIGDTAFNNCWQLTYIFYEGNKSDWNKINIGSSNKELFNCFIDYESPIKNISLVEADRYDYLLTDTNEVVFLKNKDKQIEAFNFKKEFSDYVVVAIAYQSFMGLDNLKSVFVPNTVKAIQMSAFTECPNLIIKCENDSKPEGWAHYWNSKIEVVWGSKE